MKSIVIAGSLLRRSRHAAEHTAGVPASFISSASRSLAGMSCFSIGSSPRCCRGRRPAHRKRASRGFRRTFDTSSRSCVDSGSRPVRTAVRKPDVWSRVRLEIVGRVAACAALVRHHGLHERPGGARRRTQTPSSSTSTRGFGQMWQALGLHDAFPGHDSFVTIAESDRPAHVLDSALRPDLDHHATTDRARRMDGGRRTGRRRRHHRTCELAGPTDRSSYRGTTYEAARPPVSESLRGSRIWRRAGSNWQLDHLKRRCEGRRAAVCPTAGRSSSPTRAARG